MLVLFSISLSPSSQCALEAQAIVAGSAAGYDALAATTNSPPATEDGVPSGSKRGRDHATAAAPRGRGRDRDRGSKNKNGTKARRGGAAAAAGGSSSSGSSDSSSDSS